MFYFVMDKFGMAGKCVIPSPALMYPSIGWLGARVFNVIFAHLDKLHVFAENGDLPMQLSGKDNTPLMSVCIRCFSFGFSNRA